MRTAPRQTKLVHGGRRNTGFARFRWHRQRTRVTVWRILKEKLIAPRDRRRYFAEDIETGKWLDDPGVYLELTFKPTRGAKVLDPAPPPGDRADEPPRHD